MPALIVLLLALLVACGPSPERARQRADQESTPAAEQVLALPNQPGSIKFAAIGDGGRGNRLQYDVAARMAAFRDVFPFDFVVMLGDNIYDGGTPEDYRRKFELPYKPFLDDEVEFYAAIGNHDDPNQPNYALFNMGGKRYYTFTANQSLLARLTDTDVQFFMLDTETLDPGQVAWADREMAKSEARWKIPVFHRPIYTSGRYSTPGRLFRASLQPLFLRHEIRLALSGHEHVYERTHPQQGITYFISGAAGSLREGDLRASPLTAKGYDEDCHFMLFEVTRDRLFYQAISRTGRSVDSGSITRE